MREKRREKRRKKYLYSIVLAMILSLLPVGMENLQASVWDNAYSYFQRYGNEVVFRPGSTTDGEIFCATKAAKARTKTKFRTIGWKVNIETLSGTRLQTMYFKLGGSYMYCVDTTTKSNDEYNLYVLPLGNLKMRLNTKAQKAMDKGDCRIILDACMIVVKNGKAKGAMNDNGPSSGTVYTTQSGIARAANWSSSAQQSFYNYFDKNVQGLFFRINAVGDQGISSVTGGGYYCYGTFVTLKAVVKKGYEFDMWEGEYRSAYSELSFYVNEDQRCKATTSCKKVSIIFHRNLSPDDSAIDWQTVSYGQGGNVKFDSGWKSKKGARLLGWAFRADADQIVYSEHATIKDSWILKYSPQIDLYAVWEKSADEPDPDPVIPTSDPVTPTPDPVIPTPDPVTPAPDPIIPTPDPVPPTPDTEIPTKTPETSEVNPKFPEEINLKEVHFRFISGKYFEDGNHNLISQDKGGLDPDSGWASDPALRQLLRYVLN